MKTILIPVDFSDTSTNALKYAIGLARDLKISRIILLKSFYKSIYEQLLPSADFIQLSAEDIQEERKEMDTQLQALSDLLRKALGASVEIQTTIIELPLIRSILQLIEKEQPDLLIAGSDHAVEQDESLIGQQVIAIVKTSPVPVLVVPSGVTYKKIERALVPCDFPMVSRLSLINDLSSPLDWLHPDLMVLNIDPEQEHLAHEQEHLEALKKLLTGYTFKTHYTEDKNTVQGILQFAGANDVQLIVALPGQYSFFYKFTHSSTTEALALNAKDPVLILK